jgi:hypothetical protein
MIMWTFANEYPLTFFTLAVVAMLVVRSIFVSFAKALATWGTKHCGTCACNQETHGDEEETSTLGPKRVS